MSDLPGTGDHEARSPINYGCVLIPLLMLLAVLAIVFYPVHTGTRQSEHHGCLSSIKQVATAGLIYQADWDDRNPPSDWQVGLWPYSKNAYIFTCPAVARIGKKNGYAMNSAVVGKKTTTFVNPASTVFLFETDHLVPSRVGPTSEMVFRLHDGRMSYSIAYVDGHAKRVDK